MEVIRKIIKPAKFEIKKYTEFNKKYPDQRSQVEILLDSFFKVNRKCKVDLVSNADGFVIETKCNDKPLQNVYFCYATGNDIINRFLKI